MTTDRLYNDGRPLPRFIVRQNIMNIPQPGTESVDIARFDTLEAAWIAGSMLMQLLPDEVGEFILEGSGSPNIEILEQIGTDSFRNGPSCLTFSRLTKACIDGLAAAKQELDAAMEPLPF